MDGPPGNREPPVERKDIPVQLNRAVDVLFLVDDSPSMLDKQTNVARAFPTFLDVLATSQGGLPDLHVGVVTSDLGTSGADGTSGVGIGTLGLGGCANKGKNGVLQLFGAPVSGATFLSDIRQPDGSRQVNYTGTLADSFSTMVLAGSGGCGIEQPLEAVKRALIASGMPATPNTGFLRLDALLAIVLVTDEDDCSLATPALLDPSDTTSIGPLQSFRCTRFGVTCQRGGATTDAMNTIGAKDLCGPTADATYLTQVVDYAAFLRQLKDDPRKVMVAALAGPSQPFAVELRAPSQSAAPVPALSHSCTYNGGDGVEVTDPAVRIKALLDLFPDRNHFESICRPDLSGALANVAGLIRSTIGDPCIEGQLADVDLDTPGLQPHCDVSLQVGDSRTELPACTPPDASASSKPCWHLVSDAANCGGRLSQLKIIVEGQDQLALGTHILASCQIVPPP